ncbi:unnamed protein product, partial [Closterium sp. NIES-53]
MRMRVLGLQLEERMRESEKEAESRILADSTVLGGQVEAERRRVLETREMKVQTEERESKLAAELAAVKGGLVDHKDAMSERWDMAERRRESDLRELREEARKIENAMRAELVREREERSRAVQELDWPRAMEELAACKEWQNIQDLKMNVELEIGQSEGDQKTAWERIKSASRRTD